MQGKLSITKVYGNAFRYVISHLAAFSFLTIFCFLFSLLPAIIGAQSYQFLLLILFLYLFIYFAAGFYYQQRLLLDKDIFITAGMKFLIVLVLFCGTFKLVNEILNFVINVLSQLSGNSDAVLAIFSSPLGLCCRYLFIFGLFIATFVVPAFAFISVIAGKSHSIMMAYAKTKGNLLRIIAVAGLTLCLFILMMIILKFVPLVIVSLGWAIGVTFITILYFKMYDFFYISTPIKKSKKSVNKEIKTSITDNNKVSTSVDDTAFTDEN